MTFTNSIKKHAFYALNSARELTLSGDTYAAMNQIEKLCGAAISKDYSLFSEANDPHAFPKDDITSSPDSKKYIAIDTNTLNL
jgi:hypothetical protein